MNRMNEYKILVKALDDLFLKFNMEVVIHGMPLIHYVMDQKTYLSRSLRILTSKEDFRKHLRTLCNYCEVSYSGQGGSVYIQLELCKNLDKFTMIDWVQDIIIDQKLSLLIYYNYNMLGKIEDQVTHYAEFDCYNWFYYKNNFYGKEEFHKLLRPHLI